MSYLFSSIRTLLLLLLSGASIVLHAQDRLILFTDNNSTHPSVKNFNETYIPQIKSFFEEDDITIEVKDIKDGRPAEVASIPSIYLIHDGKKFFYKGRYGTVARIKTFVDNNRRFGFSSQKNTKENLFIYEQNGFQTGLILKIKGFRFPANAKYNVQGVIDEITDGMKKGATNFSWKERYSFNEQSKLFYLNIYPYFGDDGKHYLTTETFSQHSCKEPIAQNFASPFSNKNLSISGAQIIEKFEAELNLHMVDTLFSDGLEIIREGPLKTWKELGISLSTETDNTQASSHAKLEGGLYSIIKKDQPPVSFSFAPPVSQYAGTFDEISGNFSYYKNHVIGEFEIPIKTLDMGEEVLNESVLEEQLLFAEYLTASIKFRQEFKEVVFGETIPITATLSLLGIEKEVLLETTFLEEKGEVVAITNFSINISPFQTLEKPDGPSPENETLFVNVVLFLKGI